MDTFSSDLRIHQLMKLKGFSNEAAVATIAVVGFLPLHKGSELRIMKIGQRVKTVDR